MSKAASTGEEGCGIVTLDIQGLNICGTYNNFHDNLEP